MIIDVFMFDDEFEMLDCRLYQLSGTVDQFVVCEADHTFSGLPKPYHLTQALAAGMYKGKPITVVRSATATPGPIERMPWMTPESVEAWWRENSQRRSAQDFIRLACPPDSVMIYGDLDEIPRREVLEHFAGHPVMLGLTHLVYSATLMQAGWWAGPVVGHLRDLGSDPNIVRDKRGSYPGIANAGWHLSWFGDPERRERKLTHQAHRELEPQTGQVGEALPSQRLHVDRIRQLQPYADELPAYIAKGYAPASWTREWA